MPPKNIAAENITIITPPRKPKLKPINVTDVLASHNTKRRECAKATTLAIERDIKAFALFSL